MRIALAQTNYTIGAIEDNTNKTIALIKKATTAKADLIVFPELSVCGYLPYDLLTYDIFINECYMALERIAKTCTHTAAIIGLPLRNTDNTTDKSKNKLLNAAILLHQGQIVAQVTKGMVHNGFLKEDRYFSTSSDLTCIEFKDTKIALSIGEDLWGNDEIAPMEKLTQENPDFIINMAASHFYKGQIESRQNKLTQQAQKYKLPLLYVNQVGGHTDILFDGNSMFISNKGEVLNRLSAFDEDFAIIDTDITHQTTSSPKETSSIEQVYNALTMGVKDYFHKLGFKTAVLGLSGGIDSAVCMAVAADALGAENVRAILLPSQYSSQHSIDDAEALAKNLGSPYDIIPIEDNYKSVHQSLKPIFKELPFGVTEENIQARLRGLLLMAISNKFGPILLNTSNKSEIAVGYGTLYGDTNGGLSILGDLYKTEVFALAKFINRNGIVIPEHTIDKPPSAELHPNQMDSDSLPDYDILDAILELYIEKHQGFNEIVKQGFDASIVSFVMKHVNMNEYKRHQLPPVLKVSKAAFGIDRQMPIVSRFSL